MLRGAFQDLSLFCEQDLPIIEYQGEFYWIGEEDPDESLGIDLGDECDIESGIQFSIRRCIGFPELPFEVFQADDGVPFYGAFQDNENGFLGDCVDSLDKCVLNAKEVFFDGFPDYVVFQEGNFWCLRNCCSMCENENQCDVELDRVRRRKLSVVDMDISAQEPFFSAIESGEPALIQTFRNRHLRAGGYIKFIEYAYRVYIGKDPSKIESLVFWIWVDKRFHWKTSFLNKFNDKINRYLEGDLSLEDSILSDVHALMDDFRSFELKFNEDNKG